MESKLVRIGYTSSSRDLTVVPKPLQGEVNILADVSLSHVAFACIFTDDVLFPTSVLQCANRLPQDKPRYCM